MPSEIVESKMLPEHHQERVTLMNDYGATLQIYINISMQANRSALIESGNKTLDAKQADFEAYAALHQIDVAPLKVDGLAKKAAIQKGPQ